LQLVPALSYDWKAETATHCTVLKVRCASAEMILQLVDGSVELLDGFSMLSLLGTKGPAFQQHHDPVEAGLGVRRHAKRGALGRRQILRTFG
jgi:hypothetical protein